MCVDLTAPGLGAVLAARRNSVLDVFEHPGKRGRRRLEAGGIASWVVRPATRVHFLVVSRHDASPYRQAALRGELAGERGYKISIGLPDPA
jgi:hypothetical protein